MTSRKLIFLLGFLVLPVLFWAVGVNPALARRGDAIGKQNNATLVQSQNNALIGQFEELNQEWREFTPVANEAMEDLGEFLNPILIQMRVDEKARQLNCQLRISPEAGADPKAKFRRFNINGSGSYTNLVKLVDELERGHYRIRFEEISLILPVEDGSGAPRVTLTAKFMIPTLPPDSLVQTTGQPATTPAAGQAQSQ